MVSSKILTAAEVISTLSPEIMVLSDMVVGGMNSSLVTVEPRDSWGDVASFVANTSPILRWTSSGARTAQHIDDPTSKRATHVSMPTICKLRSSVSEK